MNPESVPVQYLHLVVNNARFLILPWIACHNLASRTLALASRGLAEDWQARYAYRPVLLETFVDKARFAGACYRAANWLYLGDTQGRGKLDTHHRRGAPVKSIWVYPLVPDYRRRLCHQWTHRLGHFRLSTAKMCVIDSSSNGLPCS